MKKLPFFFLLFLFVAGCARNNPVVFEPPSQVTDTEPLEEIKMPQVQQKTDGSLWSNDTTSILSDYKPRNIGDIIVVTIAEKDSATKAASTVTGGTSTYGAGISNLFGLENSNILKKNNITPGSMVNTNFSSGLNNDAKTARTGTLTAQLSVQVIGLYPNGNLKIKGGKEVMVNNEIQIVYITGIIRPVDVTAANTIDSNKILNARISYTGKGVLSDKQSPGWLGRALDNVWPF